jgi:RHS repeat-associated protein
VTGQVIRAWDARGHAFRMAYDPARRPVQRYVATGGAAEVLVELSVYGEGQPAANLCGREYRHYDMAGYQENSRYDYAGNLLATVRQLAAGYHESVDWTPLAGLRTAASLDAAAAGAGLIPAGDGGRDTFAASTVYDALNRPIQLTAPHNPAMRPDVVRPGYDQAGLPQQVDVWLQQAAAPAALLDPATASRHAVTGVEYNARGQRLSVSSGNGVTCGYFYDPQTFRLTQLTTTRPGSFAAAQQTVQDLAYYYDPVGNVTRIADSADIQDVIFFRNQRVEPSASYSYDPLYRLISATGREHLGQTGAALSAPAQVANDDSFRTGLPQPGDGNAMGTYTETYGYDALGNLLAMAHQVSSGNWTRRYNYSEPSQIDAAQTGSRLSATSLPGDPAGGPFSGGYQHDQHGNMTTMPHLTTLTWDEDDRLRSTARQAAAGGGVPQTAYYCYDGGGQRVRKITDTQAAAGGSATRKTERIYLGGVEIYREYAADGSTVSVQRETLHVTDGARTAALVETRTAGTDPGPAQQVRYQYGNHLDSAALELDDNAAVVSYEEYFPFGSTSYQAVASQTEVPKRYRYTGKERDEENDLYYHGARYYAPWLGRWASCDPAGLADGIGRYTYARDNPVRMTDPDGRQSAEGGGDPKKPDEGADPDTPVPIKTIEERKEHADLAYDLAAFDAEAAKYLRSLSLRGAADDLRQALVGFFERDARREMEVATSYFILALAPVAPTPEGEPLLHVDLQSMFVRNESPPGLRAFNSLDSQFSLVLKDKALLTNEKISSWLHQPDWLELAIGHEPAAGVTLSVHYLDPGDLDQVSPSGLTAHVQPSIQADIADVALKARIGGKLRNIVEFKVTGALQYDIFANQWQGQIQAGAELHLTDETWSAVFQYSKPLLLNGWRPSEWHELPPSYGIGILRHY